VPLVSTDDGSGIYTEQPITTWLLLGSNVVSIKLKALPQEKTLRGTVKTIIYLHDEASEYPKPKAIYAILDYPANNDKTDNIYDEKTITFDFQENIPVKLWAHAKYITAIIDQDKLGMLKIIENLKDAILSKDTQLAVDLQGYKINDDALTEGKDSTHISNIIKQNYG
jgi:hypothetical protein